MYKNIKNLTDVMQNIDSIVEMYEDSKKLEKLAKDMPHNIHVVWQVKKIKDMIEKIYTIASKTDYDTMLNTFRSEDTSKLEKLLVLVSEHDPFDPFFEGAISDTIRGRELEAETKVEIADIDDIFVNEDDEDEVYNEYREAQIARLLEYEKEVLNIIEKQVFGFKPKHGFNASAFRNDLDSKEMFRLYKEGKSYRQIAKQFGCSPNTVTDRINKMSKMLHELDK